ncbi:MAG: ABC transporter permease [Planctomycetota bacterium]|jgi:ABC-type antimicrobial peptide transport system permease subunit
MKFWQIIKRDLFFFRRGNLATLLLAAVCCAILTGALLVGDSVQYSLKRLGQMRLGQRTQYAMSTGDRFFRQELASEIANAPDVLVVPVLAVKGILETPDGSTRVNNLNVYGVNETFWQLADESFSAESGVYVNESVRSRLSDLKGEYLLRVQKPTALSRDLIFSTENADSQAWNIKVDDVIPDDMMGRFSLQTLQEPPLNVFVPIGWLAEKIEQPGKANLLLVPNGWTGLETLENQLKESIELADLELELKRIESQNVLELRSPRIFLDAPIGETAKLAGSGGMGLLTYFVNEIRSGNKTTPYSMVAGLDASSGLALGDDEIAINEWLSIDLDVDEGDTVELTYFQVTPTRKLVEQTHTFTVARVVPVMGPFADSSLMPNFPGFSEAEGCRDWDPGIPIDLEKIRDKDEAYWDTYRGTPKAFVSLETAQKIWGNHFGSLTAVRWPASENTEADIHSSLKEKLDPTAAGFNFEDVRSAADESAAGSTDFSGLFAGLSMFLIFSAAILLGLVFVFYIESRSSQVGLLQALGWGWLKVFSLFIAEGAALALTGCVIGALASILYTRSLIAVLNATFWAKALANLQLVFNAEFKTLIIGILISFLICLFAMQLALYHRIRKPIVQLLTGLVEDFKRPKGYRIEWKLWLGVLCVIAGVLLPIQADLKQSEAATFFLSGVLLLAGCFLLAAFALKWLRLKSGSFARSLPLLAVKHIPRRTGRSLTVLITLACGVFMVVSVGANRKDLGESAGQRTSGTGGFTFLAQTTVPMTDIPQLEGTSGGIPAVAADAVVAFRQYQADDASCLNLNRAVEPTLLAVDPATLANKQAFTFQKTIETQQDVSPWLLLNEDFEENTIPAIADYSTVVWGLRKKLGDTLNYRDENGIEFNIKIVGILKESILQGRLIVAEDDFVRRFPSVDGKTVFLVDADAEQSELQAQQLMRKYRDFGLEMIPAAEKLAQLHEVENTYMAIFLILGGLGLVLGSAGLGLVLMLNVLDRSGELAMMQAVGFRVGPLTRMLFVEHGLLLAAGVICGVIPAILAVLPIIVLLAAMLVCGAIWIRLAISGTVNTNYLETLRNE